MFNALDTGHIRLLGTDCEVVLDADMAKTGDMGLCDVCNSRITIDATLERSVMEETLLHEIIHYISEKNHLKLSETKVMGLSTGLYSVIKDNLTASKKRGKK